MESLGDGSHADDEDEGSTDEDADERDKGDACDGSDTIFGGDDDAGVQRVHVAVSGGTGHCVWMEHEVLHVDFLHSQYLRVGGFWHVQPLAAWDTCEWGGTLIEWGF